MQTKRVQVGDAGQITAPPIVHEVLCSPGHPLDATTRGFMEPRLRHDFGRVRVHTDAKAAESARAVNALAYTVGQDVVFGVGGYAPGTTEGDRLLAHELTHVVQQGAAAPRSAAPHEPGTDHERPSIPRRSQDRHMLQRRVIADVLTTSVGEFYTQELTPDELRTEAALVVGALGAQKLSDAQRQLLELNLQTLEDYASAQGVELAAAAAYRLRQVIVALAIDLRGLSSQLKEILKIEVGPLEISAGSPSSPFFREADWDVQQLSWANAALSEAIGLTATAEAGGAQSAQQFRAAGTRVTAVLFVSQAVAIHVAYLHAGVVGAKVTGAAQPIAFKVSGSREHFEPMLQELRSLDAARVERAVTELQSGWHNLEHDFSVFVESLEQHAHTQHRIRQVVGIIELALLLRGLWRPRPGGGPAIGGGPGISGATAGVAVARGAVGSVEWLEAMRRLAAIGAISTAASVGRIGGGTAGNLPMPAKPTLTAASQVKPPPSWADLEKSAEASARRRPTETFGSQSGRSGNREVVIVEGEVRPPVVDVKSVEKARRSKPSVPGEHATHSVGAQLGENLPEAIVSGPASQLNLSVLKRVENATRATFDEALLHGATVETRTVLHIEHRIVQGEKVAVLLGVKRQASVRVLGSDKSTTFIDFEAHVDPVSRAVTVVRNLVLRPPR